MQIEDAAKRIIELEGALADASATIMQKSQELIERNNQLYEAELAIHQRNHAVDHYRSRFFEALEAIEVSESAHALRHGVIAEKNHPHVSLYSFKLELSQNGSNERGGEQWRWRDAAQYAPQKSL